MLRVPNDLNDKDVREEYIKNHINWFLKNHPDRVDAFLEDVVHKYSKKGVRQEVIEQSLF